MNIIGSKEGQIFHLRVQVARVNQLLVENVENVECHSRSSLRLRGCVHRIEYVKYRTIIILISINIYI